MCRVPTINQARVHARFCRAPYVSSTADQAHILCLASTQILPFVHAALVDQYLNIKLLTVSVEDVGAFPHMQSVKNCFIRGSY